MADIYYKLDKKTLEELIAHEVSAHKGSDTL